MARYQHLPIYKATYELLLEATKITRNFPRDFKSFGTQIRENLMEVILLIYRANSSKTKRVAILEVILEKMQVLELSFRLATDLRLMSINQFSSIVSLSDTILRQTNGWRNSAMSAV